MSDWIIPVSFFSGPAGVLGQDHLPWPTSEFSTSEFNDEFITPYASQHPMEMTVQQILIFLSRLRKITVAFNSGGWHSNDGFNEVTITNFSRTIDLVTVGVETESDLFRAMISEISFTGSSSGTVTVTEQPIGDPPVTPVDVIATLEGRISLTQATIIRNDGAWYVLNANIEISYHVETGAVDSDILILQSGISTDIPPGQTDLGAQVSFSGLVFSPDRVFTAAQRNIPSNDNSGSFAASISETEYWGWNGHFNTSTGALIV